MVGNIEQSAVLSAELDRIFNVTEQKDNAIFPLIICRQMRSQTN